MKNNTIKEVVVSSVLIILAILLLNPFDFWMPDMALIFMLVLTLVIFAAFSIFIVREKVRDEREASHRMFAGRIAFLIGSAVLTFGIVAQAFHHSVDGWLVVALVAMVITKLSARLYSDSKF